MIRRIIDLNQEGDEYYLLVLCEDVKAMDIWDHIYSRVEKIKSLYQCSSIMIDIIDNECYLDCCSSCYHGFLLEQEGMLKGAAVSWVMVRQRAPYKMKLKLDKQT
jgi:hypothetical protein